jgi:hypothetical protein
VVFSKFKNSPLFPKREVHHPTQSEIPVPTPLKGSQDPEPLLTPQDLAIWFKMSRIWVYKQVEKGLLPFHRVGNAIRFDPDEIRIYLKDRKDLKRICARPRNLKSKKKDAHWVTQQERENWLKFQIVVALIFRCFQIVSIKNG